MLSPSPSARGTPSSLTLGALVREIGVRCATRPAVHYHQNTSTFAALSEAVDGTARGLLGLGVRKGDHVAILFGNEPAWLVSCLAVTSIGAIAVPLNTWSTSRELQWIMRDCEVSVLLCRNRLLKHDYGAMLAGMAPELHHVDPYALQILKLPDLRCIVMQGDTSAGTLPWGKLAKQANVICSGALRSAVDCVTPADPAMVLYTSGSTAEPKGVILTHGDLIVNGYEMGHRRSITEDDVIWLGSPLFYALGSANALQIALTHGASLVLHDYFEPARALIAIESHAATVYYGTGNMTRAILKDPGFTHVRVGSLEKGNTGQSPADKRLALVELGVTRGTSAYGLTEVYGHAALGWPDDPLEVKISTDGEPLPGVEILIEDLETGESAPAGKSGRILVRGRVMSGYHANPIETSKALRADGWFDTGDLGHLDGGGRLVFDGRLKDVIKRGGINVSPLEIELLLVTHPSVSEAHVVGAPDETYGQAIVAFIAADRPTSERDIVAFLRERVASYKVPQRVLIRDPSWFPRGVSGKIAKHVLAEQAQREVGGS